MHAVKKIGRVFCPHALRGGGGGGGGGGGSLGTSLLETQVMYHCTPEVQVDKNLGLNCTCVCFSVCRSSCQLSRSAQVMPESLCSIC